MKNEKHDSAKPVPQISVPHKDAIAIEPPKKVWKSHPLLTDPAFGVVQR